MEILLACVIGYLLGGTSVMLTLYLLYDKVQPKAEPAEPEPKERAEPQEVPEPTPEEKRWLAEMAELLAYDGKGGGVVGDKENS